VRGRRRSRASTEPRRTTRGRLGELERPPRGRGKGSSRESGPPCRWDASPAAKVRISSRIEEVVEQVTRSQRKETGPFREMGPNVFCIYILMPLYL
jgi:hypothetical protein